MEAGSNIVDEGLFVVVQVDVLVLMELRLIAPDAASTSGIVS